MLRWMLFAPLAVVVAAGLTARRDTPSARRPKTAGAKSEAVREPAVQTPRSLDAAPASVAAASAAGGTNATKSERVSAALPAAPVPPSAPALYARPPFMDGARAMMLSMAAAASGKGAARLGFETDANGAQTSERGVFDENDGKFGAGYGSVGEEDARIGRNGRRGRAAQEADDAPEASAHWRPPRYAAWNPAPVYGPPLPPERILAQRYAHRLLQDMEAGRLSVMMDERDGEQLRCLERAGVYAWPAPSDGFAARSPRQRDALEGTLEDSPQTDPLLLFGSRDANKSLVLNRSAQPRQRQSRSLAGGAGESLRVENERAEKRDDRLLASRGDAPRRAPTRNPADDPDFDPCVLPPSPGLLRLLSTLAAHSTPARPLCVMSLLRPPYRYGGFVHVGPANPHSLGLAVDIAAYGGHEIRQSRPEQCVSATLALLRDLPPGRYRLGMPKAPESGWEMPPALQSLLRRAEAASAASSSAASVQTSSRPSTQTASNASVKNPLVPAPPLSDDLPVAMGDAEPSAAETRPAMGGAIAALYGLHCSSAKPAWPFFPPPYSERVEAAAIADESAAGTVPTVGTGQGSGGNARPQPELKPAFHTVLRFQNEAYAPESGLADGRLRRAIQAARERGVEIIALFPDGADHIHIDARQNP